MRRGMWIAVVLLVILAAVGIGIGAYNWGVSEGLQESGRSVEVVRYHGHGFFPFGFVFPLLFFFLIFFLIRGAFWGRRWGGGPGHHWGPREEIVEEWHRRLHERADSDRSSGEAGSA
jgi:hypothetical protein